MSGVGDLVKILAQSNANRVESQGGFSGQLVSEVPEQLRDVPTVVLRSCPLDKLVKQAPYFKVPSWAGLPRRAGCHLEVVKAAPAEIPMPSGGGAALRDKPALVLHPTGGVPTRPLLLDRYPIYLVGKDGKVCDHQQLHDSVSRVHCAIVHHQKGETFLVDLNSTYGTRVNGEKLTAMRQLADGDSITLGVSSRKLIFRVGAPQKYVRSRDDDGTHATNEDRTPAMPDPEAASSSDPVVAPEKTVDDDQPRWISHILIKHRDADNPVSRAARNKGTPITRSLHEAIALAVAVRDMHRNGEASFEKLAADVSECATSKKGGDLGEIQRDQFVPEFETAAFALRVGEVSMPTVTPLGVHLIFRRPAATTES